MFFTGDDPDAKDERTDFKLKLKFSKPIVVFLECLTMLIIILEYQVINASAKISLSSQKVTIVDVVLYDFKDKYTSRIKQNLEDIQKQNKGKVRFNFYDSKGSQVIQDEIFNKLKMLY